MSSQQSNRRTTVRAFSVLGAMAALVLLAACSGSAQIDQAQIELAQLERGHDIYDQSCQQCHGDAATGEGALPGAPVHNSAGHTWHHADSQLVDIVLGRLEYPGRTMPPFESSMTETDVMDVLAYIKIGLGHAQAEAQATVTTNSR